MEHNKFLTVVSALKDLHIRHKNCCTCCHFFLDKILIVCTCDSQCLVFEDEWLVEIQAMRVPSLFLLQFLKIEVMKCERTQEAMIIALIGVKKDPEKGLTSFLDKRQIQTRDMNIRPYKVNTK